MLKLEFGVQAGRILISCDPASARNLHTLRGRFATSTSVSNEAFGVDIDDLLVNLYELASWPAEDIDIRWQSELLLLVETNAADAQILTDRLTAVIETDATADFQLDASWQAPFTDFQSRDLHKLLELRHGANFSVPGAGKTRVALADFHTRRFRGEVQRMLVVCPKSAFESWIDEVAVCFPDNPPVIAIMDSSYVPYSDIVLVNYERLPDAWSSLLQWLRDRPALMVLDEAHRMKLGSAGAWGSACLTLGPYAARRLILTGTPAPNGSKDLENLFAFVWPGQGRRRVSAAINGRDLRAASGLLRPLFVRTTKTELHLPPVDVRIRRVNLPPLHRDIYDALLGQFSGHWHIGQGQDIEALGKVLLYLLMAATTPALLATGSSRYEPLHYRVPPLQPGLDSSLNELMRDLPQYELSPKYQEVLAIVSANAAEGRKTLIWSTFVRNLKSMEVLMSEFNPAVVHGGIDDRADQLRQFRTDPSCLVLLANPATLGEGVSLHQVCHDAIYVDRDFAAGKFLQSLDRIHRLGLPPDTNTRISILVANNTIDELVERRLALKLQFLGTVLDDPAVLQLGDLDEEPSISIGMDVEDVRSLVEYLSGSASG